MVISHRDGEFGEEEVALSLDAIFDLLTHHHRRAVLHELRQTETNRLPEDEIIALLQKQEGLRTGKQPSWDHISATLHQIHKPKLSDSGIITYDESTEQYEYHPDRRVEKWLDIIETEHGI